MIRIILMVVALYFAALPLAAQQGEYLSDPAKFTAAWSKLTAEMGADIDIAELTVRPGEIRVLARAAAGGARIDGWRVGKTKALFVTLEVVSGPDAVQPNGPVNDIESAFFPLSSVPVASLPEVFEQALDYVQLQDPGQVTDLRIARTISIIPSPAYGEVRWSISVGNARESATLTATADGRIIGADISQTARGRNQDFLTQSDWPFDAAQSTFRALIGTAPVVYEITARAKSITVEATPTEAPEALASWTWNGGAFSRSGIMMTNTALMSGRVDLPFSLDEIDLAMLPKVIAAAKAAAGDAGSIQSVRAGKRRIVTGTPAAEWVVEFGQPWNVAAFGSSSERTVIRLTPQAEVISVLLPESQRPVVDKLAGPAIFEAITKMRTTFGDTTHVFELQFRENRASAKGLSPTDDTMTLEITLTDEGFSTGTEFPVMMETSADLYPLSMLEGLDVARIDAIAAKAIEAMAMPGGEVFRLTFWSGSPFWQSPDGRPLIDVRVGMPPQFNTSGYAVFSLDGTLIEVIK